MPLAKETIVLENVMQDLVDQFPEMSFDEDSPKFKVHFDYGTKKDLNTFLATRESSDTYPLIWLLYPYRETHTRKELICENVTLILAVDTRNAMSNKERMQLTFGRVLLPLLDTLRLAFKVANIVNVSEEYRVMKSPNYSDTDLQDKSGTIAIWDALKVEFRIEVIDTCLRTLNLEQYG